MSQCCRRAGAGLNTICKVPLACERYVRKTNASRDSLHSSVVAGELDRPPDYRKAKKGKRTRKHGKDEGKTENRQLNTGPAKRKMPPGLLLREKKMNRGWESRRRLAFGAENSVSSTTRKWSTLLEARRNTSLQVGEEKFAVPHTGPASSLRKTKKAATKTPGCSAGRERNRRGYRCVTKGKNNKTNKRDTLAGWLPAALEEKKLWPSKQDHTAVSSERTALPRLILDGNIATQTAACTG